MTRRTHKEYVGFLIGYYSMNLREKTGFDEAGTGNGDTDNSKRAL
jgi:hypothetical protein